MAELSRFRQTGGNAPLSYQAQSVPGAEPERAIPPSSQAQLGGCSFFQIGYVVGNIEHAVAQFTGLFGASIKDMIRDMRDQHGEPSLIENLSHVLLNGVEIELIEPRQGWSSVYGDGTPLPEASITLHHFGFMAGDDRQWDAATSIMTEGGVERAMSVDLPSVRLIYFDTRASLGHFTELVQRRPIEQTADRTAKQGS
jgi:Glyoxalase/Bleomycin resistance protein/Dioxygenase superfamily